MNQPRRGRPPKDISARVIYEPVENALPLTEKMVLVEVVMGSPWIGGERRQIGDIEAVPEELAKRLEASGHAVTR